MILSYKMDIEAQFSAIVALTLSPALCATLLKPANEKHKQRKFFTWQRIAVAYTSRLASIWGHSSA